MSVHFYFSGTRKNVFLSNFCMGGCETKIHKIFVGKLLRISYYRKQFSLHFFIIPLQLISIMPTPGSDKCINMSSHRIDVTLDQTLWHVIPLHDEGISQLINILKIILTADTSP